MPRSGSGIYTQPFPNVIEDTTIESAVYNGFTRDVEADLNLPRPIVAGGTGGSSAAEAADNLNVLPLSGGTLTGDLEIKPGNLTIENDNPILSIAKKLSGQAVAVFGKLLTAGRWRIVLGDGAAETGANTGSDFHLENYDDAGSMLGIVMHVSRRTNVTTLTGAASPDTPILVLNKLANGAPAALRGSRGTARHAGKSCSATALSKKAATAVLIFASTDIPTRARCWVCHSASGEIAAWHLFPPRRSTRGLFSSSTRFPEPAPSRP